MPKSRVRAKPAYTPPPTRSARKMVSPRWVPALMVGFFLVGIVWITIFYVTGGDFPLMRSIGNWNLLVGFGLIIAGFITSTQWR